jgi:hypothetical protein
VAREFAPREREKQVSRDADAFALRVGSKSREQLRQENGKVRIAWIHPCMKCVLLGLQ